MRHYIASALLLTSLTACGIDDWWEDHFGEHRGGGPTSPQPRGIPVVDEQHPGQMSGQPTCPSTQPTGDTPQAPSGASPASAPAAAAAPADGKATIRGYIQKLMDETRVVPDTAAKKGGPRGSPGSFAKLSSAQVDEFVAAIMKGAELFLPKSLKNEERWALICAEVSIESAFVPGTSGTNPGDHSKVSCGPLQLTLPGMWDDIFRQYANLPGLTHYDGSPWDTKKTDNEALKTSIYDGIIAALYCITEQGRRGGPDWFGGPDGPCPKTMKTAFLAWVIGVEALKSGGDLGSYDGSGGQRDAYIASIETDLKLLGFPSSLIDTAF